MLDPTLVVKSDIGVSDVIPQSAFYQTESAQTNSKERVTWYVTSPGQGLLLSSEAYVEYTVTITNNGGTNMQESFSQGAALLAPSDSQKFALRQNYPIMRGIESASVTMNGQTLTTQPNQWVDAMNRLHLSQEESESVATASSGYYDSGDWSKITRHDVLANDSVNVDVADAAFNIKVQSRAGYSPQSAVAAGAGNNIDQIANPRVIDSDQFYNPGFTKRFERLAYWARKAGLGMEVDPSAGANTYGNSVTLTLYEPVPVAPFYMYHSRDRENKSIPHVEQFTLSYIFQSNPERAIFEATSPAATQDWTVDYFTAKPKLNLRWFMPPRDMSIPRQVSMKVWQNNSFISTTPLVTVASATAATDENGFAIVGAASGSHSFNNIRLEQIPDLLLIYYKRRPGDADFNLPSDHNMGIRNLQISVDGLSGRVLDASQGELYQLWLKNVKHNGKRSSYDDWKRYHCVVALRPRDMGLSAGPGIDRPVTLHLRSEYVSYWKAPRSGTSATSVAIDTAASYNLYVQAFYDRYFLTLTEDGKSMLELLKLPSRSLTAPVSRSAQGLSDIAL